VVPNDVWCNVKSIDHNSTVSKQKVALPFEDMLPVFVACEVIITNMYIQEIERLEEGIYWQAL
jgi:hypothetical protein